MRERRTPQPSRKPPPSTPEPPKSRLLKSRLEGQTPDAALAGMMTKGLVMNAMAAVGHSTILGDLDLTKSVAAMAGDAARVNAGDLSGVETVLVAQATTLNAIFTQLAYRTSTMQQVDHVDLFLRLALKAQSQCRATLETLETLAEIKNPPVFARQANIASGPQLQAPPPALMREADGESPQTKLLEAKREPRERMDSRATRGAGRRHQTLAAVGALNRATHG